MLSVLLTSVTHEHRLLSMNNTSNKTSARTATYYLRRTSESGLVEYIYCGTSYLATLESLRFNAAHSSAFFEIVIA
jgi:hypothetical protein